MGHARIAPFDLTNQRTAVLSVMAEALGLSPAGGQERERIVLRHSARPGLITRGVFVDGRMIGFCYGFLSDDNAWWERHVRAHLLAAGTADWLDGGAFELTELHVHPEHQGYGRGRRLISEVLDEARHSPALLTVRVGESPARRLYRSLGFRDLTPPFQFGAAQPPYLVMGVRLPLGPAGDHPLGAGSTGTRVTESLPT